MTESWMVKKPDAEGGLEMDDELEALRVANERNTKALSFISESVDFPFIVEPVPDVERVTPAKRVRPDHDCMDETATVINDRWVCKCPNGGTK